MRANSVAPMDELAEHVAENRRHWDATAGDWIGPGERAWAGEPTWGIWLVPQADVPLLPDDLSGRRAIELGCGTGYVSAWMHRRGAAVYAIDNSEKQLETARRLAAEHGADDIEWVHGNAETVPQPDESFDFAISEYGAAIWCDPFVWIPEAHRLLCSGGELVFLGHHPIAQICLSPSGDEPAGEHLERPYFGLHRVDWTEAIEDPGGVEFNLPFGEWLKLFRTTGFEVLDYWEIQAPDPDAGVAFWIPSSWASKWPSEQAWRLRKT